MTTFIIHDDSPQAEKLLEYLRTLPFAEEVPEEKQSFAEAAAECNAVSLETFDRMFADEIRKAYAK